MIKVVFEFKTVEEAIATLGKVMAGAPVAPKPSTATVPDVPTTSQPTKQRKPRADAGKPRGSYKAVEPVAEPTPMPEPETAAAPAPAEADNAQPSGVAPESAAAPTEADIQAALDKIFSAQGLTAAQNVLGRFGVQRLRELKPEDRAAFMAAVEEALK